MKNYFFLFILGLLFTMTNCEILYQNDFVERISIGEIEDNQIYCDLYQTGIDNYRYEFKLIDRKDTINLFATYLNDATANNSHFTMNSDDKNVIIKSNKPIGREVKQVNGLTITLEGKTYK